MFKLPQAGQWAGGARPWVSQGRVPIRFVLISTSQTTTEVTYVCVLQLLVHNEFVRKFEPISGTVYITEFFIDFAGNFICY